MRSSLDWNQWIQYIDYLDQQAVIVGNLKMQLRKCIQQERYEEAKGYKWAIEIYNQSDVIWDIENKYKRAIEDGNFGQAKKLAEEGLVGLEGWWQGNGKDFDFQGHLLNVEREYGRYVLKVYGPGDLDESVGGHEVRLNSKGVPKSRPPKIGHTGLPIAEIFLRKSPSNLYQMFAVGIVNESLKTSKQHLYSYRVFQSNSNDQKSETNLVPTQSTSSEMNTNSESNTSNESYTSNQTPNIPSSQNRFATRRAQRLRRGSQDSQAVAGEEEKPRLRNTDNSKSLEEEMADVLKDFKKGGYDQHAQDLDDQRQSRVLDQSQNPQEAQNKKLEDQKKSIDQRKKARAYQNQIDEHQHNLSYQIYKNLKKGSAVWEDQNLKSQDETKNLEDGNQILGGDVVGGKLDKEQEEMLYQDSGQSDRLGYQEPSNETLNPTQKDPQVAVKISEELADATQFETIAAPLQIYFSAYTLVYAIQQLEVLYEEGKFEVQEFVRGLMDILERIHAQEDILHRWRASYYKHRIEKVLPISDILKSQQDHNYLESVLKLPRPYPPKAFLIKMVQNLMEQFRSDVDGISDEITHSLDSLYPEIHKEMADAHRQSKKYETICDQLLPKDIGPKYWNLVDHDKFEKELNAFISTAEQQQQTIQQSQPRQQQQSYLEQQWQSQTLRRARGKQRSQRPQGSIHDDQISQTNWVSKSGTPPHTSLSQNGSGTQQNLQGGKIFIQDINIGAKKLRINYSKKQMELLNQFSAFNEELKIKKKDLKRDMTSEEIQAAIQSYYNKAADSDKVADSGSDIKKGDLPKLLDEDTFDLQSSEDMEQMMRETMFQNNKQVFDFLSAEYKYKDQQEQDGRGKKGQKFGNFDIKMAAFANLVGDSIHKFQESHNKFKNNIGQIFSQIKKVKDFRTILMDAYQDLRTAILQYLDKNQGNQGKKGQENAGLEKLDKQKNERVKSLKALNQKAQSFQQPLQDAVEGTQKAKIKLKNSASSHIQQDTNIRQKVNNFQELITLMRQCYQQQQHGDQSSSADKGQPQSQTTPESRTDEEEMMGEQLMEQLSSFSLQTQKFSEWLDTQEEQKNATEVVKDKMESNMIKQEEAKRGSREDIGDEEGEEEGGQETQVGETQGFNSLKDYFQAIKKQQRPSLQRVPLVFSRNNQNEFQLAIQKEAKSKKAPYYIPYNYQNVDQDSQDTVTSNFTKAIQKSMQGVDIKPKEYTFSFKQPLRYLKLHEEEPNSDAFSGVYVSDRYLQDMEVLQCYINQYGDGKYELVARKLTGDLNVPQGEISFIADLSSKIRTDYLELPFHASRFQKYKCKVRVAKVGFISPGWEQGELYHFTDKNSADKVPYEMMLVYGHKHKTPIHSLLKKVDLR